MLGLKQQIPNGRSQERPRREETRSGEECPQEVDELRMRNNLTGDVVGRSWEGKKKRDVAGARTEGSFLRLGQLELEPHLNLCNFWRECPAFDKDESRSYGQCARLAFLRC
jgi:hypothetical protein